MGKCWFHHLLMFKRQGCLLGKSPLGNDKLLVLMCMSLVPISWSIVQVRACPPTPESWDLQMPPQLARSDQVCTALPPTPLYHKKRFYNSSRYILVQLKTIPISYCKDSITFFPTNYSKAAIRNDWLSSFSRLQKPNYLNLSSEVTISNLL